jgi:hypothetical protein
MAPRQTDAALGTHDLGMLAKKISVVTDVIETVLAGKHVDVSPF